MANRKPEEISRRDFIGVSIGAAVLAGIGCGNESPAPGTGGQGTAGQPGAGGATGKGGGTGNGGTATGGSTSNGGSVTGGVTGNGGAATGGVTGDGGAVTGGVTGKGGATGSSGGATGSSGGATGSSGGATGSAGGATGSAGGATGSAGGATNKGGTTSTGGAAGGGTGTKPLVALVRNTDAIQATMDAIAAMGGFPNLTGKSVMLRPNCIDTGSPGSVNPDVIRGVIRAIKLKGTPSSIVVADDTFTGGTLARMAANGIRAAAEAEGATAVGLESGATTIANPTGATQWPSGIPFYNAVRDVDYLINMPVCKTHSSANFSMALKGWYGNVPQSARSQSHNNVTNLGSTMAEMHLVRKEDFTVLDATKCLLTGGPQVGTGTVAAPGIVAASTDSIAIDVTGVCILKHYLQQTGTANTRISGSTVWAQPQIARAMALTSLGWLTSKQSFPYSATGITEAATIMAYRDA